MEDNRLRQQVDRLQNQPPIHNAEYHFITLLGTEDGKIRRSVSSAWAGFTVTKPRREIREAVLVIPDKLRDLLNSINEPGAIVNNRKDLFLYLLGRIRMVELHWYEAHGIGKKKLKIKRYLD